eukprot:GABV01012273.1.p1 GENE.GABV01012273.1~~GABV01012273.1.p1  ORF type:complete len:126 (-),score=52.26 GABV01012273.1:11-388(-)
MSQKPENPAASLPLAEWPDTDEEDEDEFNREDESAVDLHRSPAALDLMQPAAAPPADNTQSHGQAEPETKHVEEPPTTLDVEEEEEEKRDVLGRMSMVFDRKESGAALPAKTMSAMTLSRPRVSH